MRVPLVVLAAALTLADPVRQPLPGPVAAASIPSQQQQHDHDPWIFRCVLDDNARMVVISLGNRYWAAFDAGHCGFYKIWRGDIELSGPVYDGRHGPQPKSKGPVLLIAPDDGSSAPRSSRGGDQSTPTWLGYRIANGLATLASRTGGATVRVRPSIERERLVLTYDVTGLGVGESLSFTLPPLGQTSWQADGVIAAGGSAQPSEPGTQPATRRGATRFVISANGTGTLSASLTALQP